MRIWSEGILTWRQQADTTAVLWEYGYDATDQLVSAIKRATDPQVGCRHRPSPADWLTDEGPTRPATHRAGEIALDGREIERRRLREVCEV